MYVANISSCESVTLCRKCYSVLILDSPLYICVFLNVFAGQYTCLTRSLSIRMFVIKRFYCSHCVLVTSVTCSLQSDRVWDSQREHV